MVEASDTELLDAWRNGDDKAGNQLVRRHFDALFRFFRSRIDDHVADLVQQTFLGCVESRERIPPEGFRPYLFGIARKKLLMHLRGSHRRGKVIAEVDATGVDAQAAYDMIKSEMSSN